MLFRNSLRAIPTPKKYYSLKELATDNTEFILKYLTTLEGILELFLKILTTTKKFHEKGDIHGNIAFNSVFMDETLTVMNLSAPKTDTQHNSEAQAILEIGRLVLCKELTEVLSQEDVNSTCMLSLNKLRQRMTLLDPQQRLTLDEAIRAVQRITASFNERKKNQNYSDSIFSYQKASLTRSPSFCTFHKNLFTKDQLLGKGTYGTVSLFHSDEHSSVVIKEVNFQQEISKSNSETSLWQNLSYEMTNLQHEAEINKIVHGVGEVIFHREDITLEKKIIINKKTKIHPISVKDVPIRAYLIMKKLSKNDVLMLCKKDDEFKNKYLSTPSGILELYLKILEATKKLHLKGVVHGDIKINNMCFESPDTDIQFCDFGLSRRIQDPITGKPEYTLKIDECVYLAPELSISSIQAKENQDIYALGSLLITKKEFTNLKTYIPPSVLNSPAIKELLKFSVTMRDPSPQKRPTLDAVIAKVKDISRDHAFKVKTLFSDNINNINLTFPSLIQSVEQKPSPR